VLVVVDMLETVEHVVSVGSAAQDDKSGCTVGAPDLADEFEWTEVFVSERFAHAIRILSYSMPNCCSDM